MGEESACGVAVGAASSWDALVFRGCPTRELFGRTHGERLPSNTGIQP